MTTTAIISTRTDRTSTSLRRNRLYARVLHRKLASAAELGRFADEDLAQLMHHQATARPGKVLRLDESRSLQVGTSAWAGFGS